MIKRKFIVTAGPTREHIDPVRFISNPSTGKMGYAVAAAAAARGFETVLVSGPVSIAAPEGVRLVKVVSARDMLAAVERELDDGAGAVLVATAAVADWRPAECAAQKLKKRDMKPCIELVRNPDILKSVRAKVGSREKLMLVGFAAETNDVIAEARRKCAEKSLEFIVANDVTEAGSGFGCDTNKVTFVYPDGSARSLPQMSKRDVAERIVDEIMGL
jgi:phosphopantothenoylcysteine decarboxylase/phosphopantothenate--cysteine ligase